MKHKKGKSGKMGGEATATQVVEEQEPSSQDQEVAVQDQHSQEIAVQDQSFQEVAVHDQFSQEVAEPQAGEQPAEHAEESTEAAAESSTTGGPTEDQVNVVSEGLASGNPVEELRSQIEETNNEKSGRIKSGSKPRPTVVYMLLKKPVKWSSTPQVESLQKILFSDEVLERAQKNEQGVPILTEPELFDLITKGAEEGKLMTKQNPIRIFQYYRTNLIQSNCLRWQ